jgi:hypothetical protein
MQKNAVYSAVKERLKDGDWVSGKSVNDEKFHGYIEALNAAQGTVKVKVTACDNEKSIGRTIECFMHTLELLPVEVRSDEGQLYDLIDLALSAKDKVWFMELTSQQGKASLVRSAKTNAKKIKK